MKTVLIIMCVIFFMPQVYSQSISKQVIGSSGTQIENSNTIMNFTLGEPIVGLVQNGASIHQGFWAELFSDETLSVSIPNENLEQLQIYPNPAVNYLQIKFKQDSPVDFDSRMFDINGKQVMNVPLKSVDNQLDVSNLANGIYILSISSKTTNYQKSFKIIKK